MRPRVIAALGVGQCVNWGVLYYAFAVLVLPLERELNVATWVVTGAFSVALLASAALAPAVGHRADRGRGTVAMRTGGLAAAALLVAWTLVPGVAMLYVVWAALGLTMAATLYEPAFVIVDRAFDDPAKRLRSLGAVTLFGGLASTVFLPLTALLVATLDWRGAVLVLAALLIGSVAITDLWAFRHLPPASMRPAGVRPSPPHDGRDPSSFRTISMMFALASLAGAAFIANLVPAFSERGVPPATAAMLGGLIGVMQLPGRAMLMHGALVVAPARLLAGSLGLIAAGLALAALARSASMAIGATMLFALGAGLMTLVRPHLVQTMFRDAGAGYLNGRIAQHQQIARAAGPLSVAWLASFGGYSPVFLTIASVFVLMAVGASRMPGSCGSTRARAEAA